MNNLGYRWVIVAAGGLLGCVAIGGMFSLPVLLQPIARDTGWSVTGISSAMTIGFLAMAFCSMIWGTLSDRFGPLPVVLSGSIVITISLALASRATSLMEFQLLFGLCRGRGDRCDLRADDGDRHRLVRYPSQPCGLAGLRRHGHGADDHVAAGGLVGLKPRLAHLHADRRGHRRRDHDPGLALGAPSAGVGAQAAMPADGGAAAGGNVASAKRCARRSSSSCLRRISSAAPRIPGRSSTP